MIFELKFPYTAHTLGTLTSAILAEAQNETQICFEWQWQPFHEPFFEAATYAVRQSWPWSKLEKQIGELSCAVPPKRLKKYFERGGLLDSDGCVISLDLEPCLRQSFNLVKKNLDLFENKQARLLAVTDLHAAFEKCANFWQPNLEIAPKTGLSSSFVSTILPKSPVLMKRFHSLSPWQKLAFLEPLVGVAKSSSFLHFQRIDAPQ